jgi:hypothetical protein
MKPEPLEWFTLVADIALVSAYAFLEGSQWKHPAHAENRGGKLLLSARGPAVMLWVIAVFALGWALLLAKGAECLYLVAFARPIPPGRFANEMTWFLVLLIVGILSWPYRRPENLELREHGIVHGEAYWPWESIQEWGWTEPADTLRLKLANDYALIRVSPADRAAVQSILAEHVAESSAVG